jgi:SPP1 gp7 family putative phage head morphogenesis protein
MSEPSKPGPAQNQRPGDDPNQAPAPERKSLAECVRAVLNLKWAEEEIMDQKSEVRAAGDELVGFLFSAARDDQTCPLCAHLDGMTVDINDPDVLLLVPPLHEGCRCVALYQTRDMRNPLKERDFVRPPRELLDKYLAPARRPRTE